MTTRPEVTLGEVAQFVRGITFKPTDVEPLGTSGSIACMRTANVQAEMDLDDVWAVPEAFCRRDEQRLRRGDLLVSTANSWNLVGKCAWVGDLPWASTFGGFISVLRPSSSTLDPRYLYRWFSSPRVQATLRSYGRRTTSISNLSLEQCRAMPVPLPPIEEQRRIAAVLDQSDELRAKRRFSLALLDSLAEPIFVDMFGDPSSWTRAERPLIDLIDPERPISYGILKPGPHIDSGVPYVRVVDMRLGGVDFTAVKRTSAEISDQYRRSLLRPGDLLLSIRGHVGRLAEVPPKLEGANITQDTARLAIKEANPRFVLQFLRSSWAQRWMEGNTKGAAVRGINLGDVKRLPVPVFDRDAQDEFVRRARLAERTAVVQQKSAEALATLFGSLQHRAFAGTL